MSRLTRDGTAEPVSRDQILRHARGQGNVHFPCSADHEQDWQPYPVDPYSAICDDHTYIHTYYYYLVEGRPTNLMSRMNEYREQHSRILVLRSRISFSRRVIATKDTTRRSRVHSDFSLINNTQLDEVLYCLWLCFSCVLT